MMPAGSADLGGPARCGLAQHISQIQCCGQVGRPRFNGVVLGSVPPSVNLNRIRLFCHGFTAKPAEEPP